jgi:hypothetical protein
VRAPVDRFGHRAVAHERRVIVESRDRIVERAALVHPARGGKLGGHAILGRDLRDQGLERRATSDRTCEIGAAARSTAQAEPMHASAAANLIALDDARGAILRLQRSALAGRARL